MPPEKITRGKERKKDVELTIHVPVLGALDLRGRKPFFRLTMPDGIVYDMSRKAATVFLAALEKFDDRSPSATAVLDVLRARLKTP